MYATTSQYAAINAALRLPMSALATTETRPIVLAASFWFSADRRDLWLSRSVTGSYLSGTDKYSQLSNDTPRPIAFGRLDGKTKPASGMA